jgi:hypothetical protein
MKKNLIPVFEVRTVPCPPEQRMLWLQAMALWWKRVTPDANMAKEVDIREIRPDLVKKA